MQLSDLHSHTLFSSDGRSSIEEMSAAAEKLGLFSVAFTEHYDFLPEGAKGPAYGDNRAHYIARAAIARRAVIETRERYNGRLNMIYAIEVGQPHMNILSSRKFLSEHDFDFVVGAVHIDKTFNDYYFLDYNNKDFDVMFREYYAENLKLAQFGGFDTIAHLDYPVRVLEHFLKKPASMIAYRDEIAEVLRECIHQGIALEINTNGLRKWYGRLSPERWVVELYHDLGGRYVTTGSDGHDIFELGTGIREAAELAFSCGIGIAVNYIKRRPDIIMP